MNTQVNSETPVQHVPTVTVAETAPVALTPVAAAVAPTTQAPMTAKRVIDDFLDADDEVEATKEQPQTGVELPNGDGAGDDLDSGDTIAEFEEDSPGVGGSSDEGDAGAGDEDLNGLADLEEVIEEEQAMVVIDVFKKKCTDCTHLVPWGTKTHKRCHFSNGNDLCPAQSVRIRRHIPVDEIVSRFMAAESQGDTDRLVLLYENLKKKAADVQEEIHAGLKAARERRAQRAAV